MCTLCTLVKKPINLSFEISFGHFFSVYSVSVALRQTRSQGLLYIMLITPANLCLMHM